MIALSQWTLLQHSVDAIEISVEGSS